jgi:tripartite ATP-independent transporter DctP family solute receptor
VARTIWGAALFASALAISGAASAADVVARFGFVGTEEHPSSQALQRFAQLVSTRTNGSVQIQLFLAGQLGGEKEMSEQLRLNSLQGALVTNAALSSWVPEGQIFDLPFIFRDDDHAFSVTTGPIGARLAQRFKPHGFHVSAFWVVGTRHPMGTIPVRAPDDVKGKKMRVIQSPLHIEIWRTLGANPTPIPHTEIYNSVQTGVVDILDNSMTTYWFSKFYEVAPHFTLLGHIYAVGPIVFSEQFWRRLTPAQQAAIDRSALDAAHFQNNLIVLNEEKALASAEKAGSKVVRNVDKAPWRKAMAPIWEKWAPQVGGIERINEIVNSN